MKLKEKVRESVRQTYGNIAAKASKGSATGILNLAAVRQIWKKRADLLTVVVVKRS